MRGYSEQNSCFRYHKGTDFQANHNTMLASVCIRYVVLDTTKVQIFKQITTKQAVENVRKLVVLDTTKVQIFKQITTENHRHNIRRSLF